MQYLYLIGYLLTLLMITGSIEFIIGSIMYLPSISNFTLGATLFITGSASFLLCDIIVFSLKPPHSPLKKHIRFKDISIGITFLGNLFFVVGSVMFLPWMNPQIGSLCFIDGAIIICLAETLIIYCLCTEEKQFTKIFKEFHLMRIEIIRIITSLAIGCIIFIPGLIVSLLWPDQQFFSAICYIVGSLCFLIGSVWDAKLRHIDIQKYNSDNEGLLFVESIHV